MHAESSTHVSSDAYCFSSLGAQATAALTEDLASVLEEVQALGQTVKMLTQGQQHSGHVAAGVGALRSRFRIFVYTCRCADTAAVATGALPPPCIRVTQEQGGARKQRCSRGFVLWVEGNWSFPMLQEACASKLSLSAACRLCLIQGDIEVLQVMRLLLRATPLSGQTQGW